MLFLSALYITASLWTTQASVFPRAEDPSVGLDDSAGETWCPQRRSVWSILWTCWVTIFACTWVAVHPDIRRPTASGNNKWVGLLRRAELLFWGLAAPELLVAFAFHQWKGARDIQREMTRKLESAKARANPNCEFIDWTIVHSHFLQMRGYLFEKDGEVRALDVFSAGEDEKAAFQALIRRTSDTRVELEDRSKGDALAKGFVLLQTCWFTVQCIARGVQRLSITEIELVTLAYAVLNAVLYFFWWDKRLDVQCPIIIPLSAPQTATTVAPLAAGPGRAAVVHSFYRNSNTVSEPYIPNSDNHESHPRSRHHESTSLLPRRAEGENERPLSTGRQRLRRILEAARRPLQRLFPRTNLNAIVAPLLEETTISVFRLGWLYTKTEGRSLFIRLCLVLVSFPISLFLHVLFLVRDVIVLDPFLDPDNAPSLTSRLGQISEWAEKLVEGSELTMRVAVFPASFLASLFGAIHCVAISPSWPFSSPVYRYLWATAALHICLSPFILALTYLIGFIYKGTSEADPAKRRLRVLFIGLVFITYVSLFFYLPARIALVYISLVELADLPRSAYQPVQWLEFLPHM